MGSACSRMRGGEEAGAPGTAAIEIPAGERRLIPHVHIPHGKGFFGSPSEEQEMSWASTKHVQSAAASDMSPVARKAKMRQAMQNMGSVPVMVSDPDLSQPHIRKDYSHRKFSQSYKNKDVLAGVWPDIDDEVYMSGMLLIGTFQFDASRYTAYELMHFVLGMFTSEALQPSSMRRPDYQDAESDIFPLDPISLCPFIAAVRHDMLEHPYHNWTHAVDVMQAAYSLALANGTFSRLDPLQGFAFLVSALCADIRHPGVTNGFLIATSAPEAILYNDRHVLEMMHACRTCQLLNNRDVLPLPRDLTRAEYNAIRSVVVGNILATDMTEHSRFSDRLLRTHQTLQSHLQADNNPPSANPAKPRASEDIIDVHLEMQVMIKVADISNVCRPLHVAKYWAVRIAQEMFEQGEREMALGLPVSPMCDSTTQSIVDLEKNWIDKIVGPFFLRVRAVYPSLGSLLGNLSATREEWEEYIGDDRLLSEMNQEESNPILSMDGLTMTPTVLPANDVPGGGMSSRRT